MKVITVAHQKGGVGKTTLALNLAYCFADSLKTCLVDADVQGSLTYLRDLFMNVDVAGIDALIGGQLSDYQAVIVDTPPYLSNRLPELFAISDYILIPSKAGFLDALATQATLQLVKEAVIKRPALKAGIVLNMVQARTSLNEEVRGMLAGFGFTVHKTMISQRVSYTRSPMTNSVFGSEDEKAKNEVVLLATEIMESINS